MTNLLVRGGWKPFSEAGFSEARRPMFWAAMSLGLRARKVG